MRAMDYRCKRLLYLPKAGKKSVLLCHWRRTVSCIIHDDGLDLPRNAISADKKSGTEPCIQTSILSYVRTHGISISLILPVLILEF
jgi:hypothetical protein